MTVEYNGYIERMMAEGRDPEEVKKAIEFWGPEAGVVAGAEKIDSEKVGVKEAKIEEKQG